MVREIQIPEDIAKLSKAQLEIAVSNNDDVLLSHCKSKRPRFGGITNYGIAWRTFEDLQKDAEETCHEYYQLIVFYGKDFIIAPAHADEVFNLHKNPLTGEKLS